MNFREAVLATQDIKSGYCSGLTALGNNSSKVVVDNTRLLQGSVDIDNCTSIKYARENRWDYALAYHNEVYFIEIHPAISSEVKTVLEKLAWLKKWLQHDAPEINKMKARTRSAFYWIQSKNFSIPQNSPQYRAAMSHGLKPISKLHLD